MARNEHKKVLQQLSEAYQRVYKEVTDIPFPPGNAYGGPYSPGHAFTATKRFQVLGVGGRHSEHTQFVDEFDTVDEVINSINLPEEYGTEWAEEIKDVSNWSSEGFEDGLRRFGIGEVYEVIDIGSYEDDDLVSSHLDEPTPWPREDAESDAGLWRDQMKHQSKVSPEELERIKKQKPAPQGRLTMPGDKDRDDTRTLKEMQRDIMNGMTAKESMEGMGIHPANQKSLLAKYMEFSKGSEGPIETGFEDNEEIDIGTMVTWNQDGPMKGEVVDVDVEQGFAVVETGFADGRHVVDLGELTKAIRRKPRSTQTRFPETRPGRPGFRPAEDNEERVRLTLDSPGTASVHLPKGDPRIQKYLDLGYKIVKDYKKATQSEDNEDSIIPEDERDEPVRARRGITGYEHKPDALVAARQAGAKHKPYVSSFVSDGGKIFGVMGSDGKIVHKTRDKQKAYKWFRDNYENI